MRNFTQIPETALHIYTAISRKYDAFHFKQILLLYIARCTTASMIYNPMARYI